MRRLTSAATLHRTLPTARPPLPDRAIPDCRAVRPGLTMVAMAEFRFKTPLTEADVPQLAIGDSVTLDGIIFGVRDANLIRVFDQGVRPPVDWQGAALLHTAPNVGKVGPGKYEPLSVGTTTSMRMDRFTEALLRDYGVRAILGKGGLSARSGELMPECIWQIRFKGLGPLTVGIDARGGNLQLDVQTQAERKAGEILRRMGVA